MNSDQEKLFFLRYSWEYNYVQRKWVAPNGCEITIEQIVEVTSDREGEGALMALVVENGIYEDA